MASDGSSPLARGLLDEDRDREYLSRIIPARAGFTQSATLKGTLSWDHPRSRGVYRALDRGLRVPQGSSPLARGLLRPNTPQSRHHRIIPARAGFTSRSTWAARSAPDHPRSRGVYTTERRGGPRMDGSSPLARGLRRGSPRPGSRRGIIPARAGFTRYGWRHCPAGRDHPRSRGVYSHGLSRRFAHLGSSPLARGLLEEGRDGLPHGWIIPARAGFTTGRSTYRTRTGDHPRSRGVYTCGSLESQRTHTLPDPCRLHCRPRTRSAGSRQRRRVRGGALHCWTCWTRLGRCGASALVRTPPPIRTDEWQRRPARSGSRQSGGSAPPRSRG